MAQEEEKQSDANSLGRYIPPWREPYIIAMAGSSGSGKTSIAQNIIKQLNVPWTVLLSMDNFYKPLTEEQRKLAFQSKFDFDSPEVIDLDLFARVLADLKAGRRTRIPTYSFVTHNRTDKWITLYGANVIIFEGIYALYDPRVLALTDLKVFIDTPLDICLARRLARDIEQRGRSIGLSVQQWMRYVKPNFEQHMRHTMYYSDMRIPRGIKNTVAIDLLISHIRQQLQIKSNQHMDYLLSLNDSSEANLSSTSTSSNDKQGDSNNNADSFTLRSHPENLTIIKQTNQVRALHTIILNTSNTSRADFVFYFNRMATILLNEALCQLDDAFYTHVPDIITPTGSVVQDSIRSAGTLAAISMIRGGGCFEPALRRVLGGDGRANQIDGGLGEVLIQSDARTGEPHLHTLTLPPCIDPRLTRDGTLNSADCSAQAATRVLLLDSQLVSGAAITMAASILLDHGIREEHIIVVTYLASPMAISRLSTAFPKLKMVVGHCESKIYPRFIDSMYYGCQ